MPDFPPYRPPSEAHSALIRVTRGCHWNHCTFCGMYKNTNFESKPVADIEQEMSDYQPFFSGFETLFIGDSDSLAHPDIVTIIGLIRKAFPKIKRITSYARASTLVRKSKSDLGKLKMAGLSRLHVGLESGHPGTLKNIRKGATPEVMIKAGLKAKQVSLELCFYVISGIAGNGEWALHAEKTADVINKVNPDFVRLRALTAVTGTPLYESWKKGEFTPITPLNRLKETRKFIVKLIRFTHQLASDHVTNYLWGPEGIIFQGINGTLPKDKERLVAELDEVIQLIQDREDILDANILAQQGIALRL